MSLIISLLPDNRIILSAKQYRIQHLNIMIIHINILPFSFIHISSPLNLFQSVLIRNR